MTWVIGRAGPFGHAVALSDIRVTLGDGREFDCLRKIYYIAPQMAVGFAGSVAIGFEMIAHLAHPLNPPPGQMVIPSVIAQAWPAAARRLFEQFEESQRELGCELMLLAAHPAENDGAAPWARCNVYTFRDPDFEPVLARGPEIMSIGSGSDSEHYQKALERLQADPSLFHLQTLHPQGASLGLVHAVSEELKKHPEPGISPHLHICVVGRDGVEIGANNTITYGEPEERFEMPKVATNPTELDALLNDLSAGDTAFARC